MIISGTRISHLDSEWYFYNASELCYISSNFKISIITLRESEVLRDQTWNKISKTFKKSESPNHYDVMS
jgi:hypothetical protein